MLFVPQVTPHLLLLQDLNERPQVAQIGGRVLPFLSRYLPPDPSGSGFVNLDHLQGLSRCSRVWLHLE